MPHIKHRPISLNVGMQKDPRIVEGSSGLYKMVLEFWSEPCSLTNWYPMIP